jgi:tripartite-type tricarboxylate transporter receptor subunit TctC
MNVYFGLAALCVAQLAGYAHAQQKPAHYPTKPIRVLVTIAAGGGPDIVIRMVSHVVNAKLGQPFIVDNRPGGGTVIATDIVAHAPADGYTLLLSTDTLLFVGATKRVAYDVRKAFDPVVQMTAQPYLLVVTPSLPVKTIKELIAHAKARPNVLNYASASVFGMGHLAMERFKSLTGTQIVHVAYKGTAPAFLDLIAGQIHIMVASPVSATQHIVSGKVRALSVCGAKRLAHLPDVPTMNEAGIADFYAGNNYNLVAPAGTPRNIIQILNGVVSAGLNTPEMIKRLAADGSEAAPPASPEAFRAKMLHEYAQVEKQVRELNIK